MTDKAAARETVVVERKMPHPPEKIWRALTQGALIAEWLMPNDFAPVLGHRFKFRSTPMPPHWDGVVDCEVLALEENRLLSYSWNTSGADAAAGLRTTVTFTLEPAAGGTLLRIEQSGFGAEDRRNYQGASYGWQKFLGELERVAGALP